MFLTLSVSLRAQQARPAVTPRTGAYNPLRETLSLTTARATLPLVLEDINGCTRVATLQFTGGKYSITADGRGTLQLTNSTGTTNYSIVLSSTAAGSIVQTDPAATASGSFQHQNGAAFSNAAIAGGYVFHLNGVDVSGTSTNPGSYIGRFDADGAGAIFNGLFDSNIGGTLSGQQLFPAGASYRLDTNGDGTTFGRATD
jgi:hypothetical protein